MANPIFGDPERKDGTAKLEQAINRVGADFVLRVQNASKLLNRPLGSQPLSLPEQKDDYEQNYKGNIPAKLKLFERIQQQVKNPIQAAAEYANWIIEMEAD